MTMRPRAGGTPEIIILAALLVIGWTGAFLYNVVLGYGDVQYLWLADSFLHGRLDIPGELLRATTVMDTVLRDGRYYWPLGPLPAVLFMPAVAAFGASWSVQGAGQVVFAACAFALAFALARREGFGRRDATWLATALCFGSVLVGVIDMGMPWHMADLLTAASMLAALVEWKGRDRPLVTGTFIALAIAARPQAAVAAGFFFLHGILRDGVGAKSLRRLARMAAPVALVVLALGAYDAARFGSPFDTGQRDHFLRPGAVAERRDAAVFDATRIPGNFFWYFLALPEVRDGLPVARPDGVSAVLLSPVFLWLAFARKRDPATIAAAAATALSLLMYLSYFGTGNRQFGPRYLTDALPLLYLVLLGVFKRRGLPASAKAVIAASVAANAYLFSVFASYYVFVALR